VFFDNVRARAENLVGEKNGGWTIAKRLLEHERAMISDFAGAGAPRPRASRKTGKAKLYRGLADTVKAYVGERDGRLADPILRDTITQVEMDSLCFGLTSRRVVEELKSGQGPGHAASMLKWYATELNKRRQETLVSAMGSQALGWEGERFSPQELAQTRAWLRSKGNSIEGGTSEVQMNVLAKRALGLPD
jgi:alkylation response protein AidB-like acyl-CoA dehydrogenase